MSATVTIQIKYLSAVRDRVGRSMDTVSFFEDATLEDVRRWLDAHRFLKLPDPHIMSTLNGRGWRQLPDRLATPVKTGDTVLIFTTISGG